MIINHNIAAMNTHRQLGSNNAAASKNLEKLSSGLKINKAGDDAAGLAISEKMRGQIRGLDMAAKNSQDGISLIQTAEGALNETHDILQRMRELAVQAGNDTNTDKDRGEIQKEINSLTSEVNRIGNTTEFNTQKLLNSEKDGSAAVAGVQGKYTLTLTAGAAASDKVTIDGKELTFGGAAADETAAASALKTLIEADTDLNAKYTVTTAAGVITLEQKAGSESATAPTSTLGTVATATEGVKGKAAGAGDSLNFQIGANQNQSLTLDISDMRASALGITTAGTNADLAVNDGTSKTQTEQALDVSTHEKAAEAVTKFQQAIDTVSAERSKLGATQNRLEHTINNLGTSSENLTAAESRIRDVDYVLSAA
ncbi:flagellin [Sporosarcina aquimarina]|uniref:flagellin N-terminal helical domain-containing protein n=1 Tax=Sporosarcina aquimarina TaxID=114975 RepID=UPI002559DAA0|nr:flagellin [Sporosarcina aquimarina]